MNEEADFKRRLSMIDESGHRRFIIPAEVKGFFKTRKRVVHFVLLLIFLIIPWIYIGGEQAVLLNLSARQFHFFGLHLQAHDAPLIFFVLLGLTMALALVTALWGRVWCGWACPQTVFIESLYRQIEIWTEGNYIQRRKLQQEPFSFRKLKKTGLKWLLYIAISILISHSFLAYWTGSRELLQMMGTSPTENWFYFVLVMAMTGILLFNFAWFREQFCLIVCPYGKIQSVLMDSHSVTVMYDEKRGEPRKAKGQAAAQQVKENSAAQVGDCVSCQRCVQVCPTGIDIRNGLQMECIGCTACIDACDEIMTKVNKPKGLIRYKALTTKKVRWFRARVLAYSSILVFSLLGLIISLAGKDSIRIEVLRAHSVPYQLRTNEGKTTVENHFLLRLENSTSDRRELQLSLTDQDIKWVLPGNPVPIDSNQKKDFPLFLEIPQEKFKSGSAEIEIHLEDLKTHQIYKKTIKAVGPYSTSSSSESVENP